MIRQTESIFEAVLQKQFKSALEASCEIINLKAILDLPKPTEHFLSDLHGEYFAFMHMVKNSSGLIKSKIEQEFATSLTPAQKDNLALCVAYPKEIIRKMKKENGDFDKWQSETIKRLIKVTRVVSRKYTRSKVRKSLPGEYSYIIEELLYETDHGGNKNEYYDAVVRNITGLGIADSFMIKLCEAIQRLSVDSLHIVGDIYDRGPFPHKILDELANFHAVDVQWGNHDVVWMGASCGSKVCIANVIRICARYGYLNIIEEGYGINLRKLYDFAARVYENEGGKSFAVVADESCTSFEKDIIEKVHKAITVMQFKLEGQLIKRNPEYGMQQRLLLDKILDNGKSIEIGGAKYDMNDCFLPTLDCNDPYSLTEEENEVMDKLQRLFEKNEKLAGHTMFLFNKGSIYLVRNDNLLIHGCIPMDEQGNLSSFEKQGNKLRGKELLDYFEEELRASYGKNDRSDADTDIFWYLWCGENSPLFGKKEMKTFERYFIDEPGLWAEAPNPYYLFWEDAQKCDEILKEFGISGEFGHIINGHVPVRAHSGEKPVKAGGKLIVIDGGLNPIYNPVTGTAGYTLIFDSYGLVLAAHEKFVSKDKIIDEGKDIVSYFSQCDRVACRIRVKDTDTGKRIKMEIKSLEAILEAYRQGRIKENQAFSSFKRSGP